MLKLAVKLVVGGVTEDPAVRQELIGYLAGAKTRQPYFGGPVFWKLDLSTKQSLDFNVADIDHQMPLTAQTMSKGADIVFMVFDQAFKPKQMEENWSQIRKGVGSRAIIYIVQIEGEEPDEQATQFAATQRLLFAHVKLDSHEPAKLLVESALKHWAAFTVLDDDERGKINSTLDKARSSVI
ncbi:hypothetical protein [Legionella shakespearei]|uniref:Uncharacterized protein n=1 Tax=Legionella shakespearei DSM 23087 TaxID=1122169 RepID=A0A0W0Z3J4_9GAMM|nr:hypothetical protein [Legionella shakespearei]KTD63423.1 hypothetical protein Lsha_0718 [Legionella shakespearei DSM 23087]